MRIPFLAAIAALMLPFALHASQKSFEVDEIVAQQQQIKADVIAKKGRYADMPSRQRNELISKQQSLLTMLEGKQSSDELTESQRIEAFNTLEWIEAAINKQEEDRMICIREKTIGSNRVTRTCRTADQWAIARENARDFMSHKFACSDLGGVGCTSD